MSDRWRILRGVGVVTVTWLHLSAVGSAEEPKKAEFQVTIGDRVTAGVVPGKPSQIVKVMGPESSLVGAQFFELSPYRVAKVRWPKGLRVEVRLYGEMKVGKVPEEKSRERAKSEGARFFVADCGLVSAFEVEWTFDPSDLLCQGDFVDGAAVIEIRVKAVAPLDDRAIYFRVKNRRFPFVGSDLGIALTLTQPLSAEDDLDKGFEVNDGLSIYYAVSRLKSNRWRLITSLAALDHVRAPAGETEDPEDFELGLGFGAMFKSNGFLDSKTGMSLAAGAGYNFMVPDSEKRWYWFFGVGANFGRANESSK